LDPLATAAADAEDSPTLPEASSPITPIPALATRPNAGKSLSKLSISTLLELEDNCALNPSFWKSKCVCVELRLSKISLDSGESEGQVVRRSL
jgi:hypothetical protein